MKNFTNNFKQFTSRLSARWLIMALMMLVGTSSAWAATLYLRGSFNGWGTGNQFVNNSCSITLNAGTYEFKIGSDNWSVGYGNKGTMERTNCSGWKMDAGDNCHINADVTGTYTFEFNESTKILSVTYPPQCATCCTNYYVAGDAGLCGEGWNANADIMGCSNNVWSLTFKNIVAGTYKFKITNGSWNTDSDKDNEFNSFDNTKGNVTCKDDGSNDHNIQFTTTSKGNITISFNGTKAWVDFEQPCYSSSDVEPGTISSNATNNTICGSGTVELTLSNTTTKDGLTKSIQWQKQSGNTWSDINNANSTTYTTENLSATTIYRAKVTWKKTGCDNIVEYANVTVTVNALPSAPELTNPDPICEGDKITLPTVTGAWYADATITNTLANTTVSPSFGTTSYFATAKEKGCESSSRTEYVVKVKSLASANNYELTNTTADYTGTKVTLQPRDVTVKNNAGAVSSIYFKQDAINVGTYKVYVTTEANNTYCAATDLEIGEFTINCKAPTEVDFVYSGATVTYDGNAQAQTVTWANNNDKGGAITVWYKSGSEYTQTAPTNAGVYTVAVTSDAAGNYCEAKQKIEKKETLTIQCAEATKTQYPFEPVSFEYDGIAHTPTITPATGAGKITKTVYKKDNEIVENPTEVGEYTIYVTSEKGTGYCAVTDLEVGSFTITCDKPVNPILSKTNVERCNGNVATYGTITITNFEQYESNYKFYLGRSEVTPTNEGVLGGIDFPGNDSEIYTVKVTNTCGATTLESDGVQITLEAEDITPVVGTLTLPEDFESCDGKGISLALTDWNPETGFTYNYIWEKSADGNTYSTFTGTNSANVTTQLSGTTWYRVKVTKTGNGCTSPEATSNAVKVTALPVSKAAVSITAASYDMYSKKFSVTGVLNNAACSQDIYVGYQYKLSNDDTWKPIVNTHRLTGADAKDGAIFTKDDIEIANATPGQKYIFRTYAINGYPKYEESSAVYSLNTIEVEVKDGYTVYVRRPKNGEDIYTKWYELSSVKGGLSYVKSGAINGTGNNDNQATTNNTGGTEMSYAFTDCDGYTWDSFKPEEGQTKFYIHALNDDAQNGWATFSQTATITSGQDNYFILSSWNNQYGVPITSTNQPTLGITIKALGSKEVISTNMASFAALYLYGNCTGKDFPRDADGVPTNCFQWKYSSDNGATWSDYSGAGAKWNNIRPTAAGSYKLVCTMSDNTTAESDTIKITTKSVTYADSKLINIESALPIIMVNTGDNKGFPGCSVAGNDYPSKHADAFKEKLSVDVKIKVGDEIVYDKKARMNYRGSSSLNFKKKSYAFCPGADMCGVDEDKTSDFVDTKKMDMLSLITKGAKTSAKDKDWVLYAATPDPSMMRNILAMETFSAMTGNWGVKNQYVELYVDGEYQGVYVFMDKITQNKDRVDITWNVDGSSKEFIVKFDKTDYADRYEFTNGDQKTFESSLGTGNTGAFSYYTEIDQRFEIEYPEKKDIIKKGGSWDEVYSFAKGKIDAFEAALKDGDFNTVRSIIDYKSWADFFILTEFAKNGDGFRASCVFVYEDDLLRAYPLWDYELSFDNETRQEHDVDKTTGLLVNSTTYSKVNGSGNNGTFPAPFWWTGNYYNNKQYKGLLDDPCFISMVNARWEEHTKEGGALSKVKLEALVSKYNTALTTADATTNKVGGVTLNTPQKREAQKWPYNGATRGKTCNDKTIGYYGQDAGNAISEVEDFSDSKSTLDTWIGDGDTGRRKGLKAEIDKLLEDVEFAITVVADKTTTTPWRPVTITVNSNSGYEYSVEPKPAKIEENGHIYTLYFARPEGTVGTNFDTKNEFYTFTATTGQADQCGTTQGSTTSDYVKISLADVKENCPQP